MFEVLFCPNYIWTIIWYQISDFEAKLLQKWGINFEENSSCGQKNVITQILQRLYNFIFTLEVETKRKTLLAEAAAAAANANEAKNPLECWDYVYRYSSCNLEVTKSFFSFYDSVVVRWDPKVSHKFWHMNIRVVGSFHSFSFIWKSKK